MQAIGKAYRDLARTLQLAEHIGVVVIGRNEGQRLISCLMSIDPQKITTVYVDSGSTDGSVSAAERLGAKVVTLSNATPFTAARARNEGYAALKALRSQVRFVQFVDGDCELDPNWFGVALEFILNQDDVAVVCGRRREKHPEVSIYNWLCDVEWNTPAGQASACGGDSLVRMSAFEEVAGFEAQLIAHEEPELCLRLRAEGWKIWRLDCEMTRHDADILRFGQWWTRTVRSGYGFAEASKLHSQYGVQGKETARAIVWGGLTPALIGFGTLVYPNVLWVALIYPLQICRIALRRGFTNIDWWIYALYIVLGKFAEFQGIVKFYWRRWRGLRADLMEYKKSG